MQNHIEIEFKTLIDEITYLALLKEFGLEDKTFIQTNYYFDTNNNDLMNKKTVLRIRKKEQYKLTKKEKGNNSNLETSLYLTNEQALNMIKNGFDASIINEPYFVKNICSLQTIRAKTNYKDGIIFFDKSTYLDKTDYEIEFEASDYENGLKTFTNFLIERNIEKKDAISKSKRAFNLYNEKKKKGC
jgi:uncharacterized protein YjbK